MPAFGTSSWTAPWASLGRWLYWLESTLDVLHDSSSRERPAGPGLGPPLDGGRSPGPRAAAREGREAPRFVEGLRSRPGTHRCARAAPGALETRVHPDGG